MSQSKKISIITPSYNCANYIRHCIESVLSQNYENFEHIIVDGASQDGTVDILQEYPHLKWISEPDKGEAEALNKALRMVTGDIIGWLNADDLYIGNIFHKIADEINPQQGRHVVVGKVLIINERDEIIGVRIPKMPVTLSSLMQWFGHTHLYQPSMFYSQELVRDVGYYREELYFSIDYDYWLRIAAKGYQYHYIDQTLSKARLIRTGAKSANPRVEQEENWQDVCTSYQDYLTPLERINFWRDYYEYKLQRYQEYPQSQPPDKYALIGLSLLLIDRGYLPDIRFLINHLVNESDCADIYWLLGESLYRTGYPNEAKQVFERAVALETETQAVFNASTPSVSPPDAELPDSSLPTPINFREINLIVFPDWSQPEESLSSDLVPVIRTVLTHPAKHRICLLIDINNIAEEDANRIFSDILTNLLQQEGLSVDEGGAIYLIGECQEIERKTLLEHINLRIVLVNENQQAIAQLGAENLPGYLIADNSEELLQEQNLALILQKISEKPWFHAFEVLPGIITPGAVRIEGNVLLDSLEVPTNLSGLKALDIGTWDGVYAFELENRGATVTALDIQNPDSTGFNLAKELRKSQVAYIQANVYDLTNVLDEKFDFICFFGVFYHLKHPILAFEQINAVLQDDGLLLIEGECLRNYAETLSGKPILLKEGSLDLTVLADSDVPLTLSYPGRYKNASNWFIPNLACVCSWLNAAGLEIIKYNFLEDLNARMPDGAILPNQRLIAVVQKIKGEALSVEEHPVFDGTQKFKKYDE